MKAIKLSIYLCTACSKEKITTAGLIPALDRYASSRIRSISHKAEINDLGFLILSGKYGLIEAQQPIPWYDHLLVAEEVKPMVALVSRQLKALQVESLTFYAVDEQQDPSWQPYCEVIRQSTATTGVKLILKII